MYAYFNRGRANLYAGALPKALADLDQATAVHPKYAYAALWLDIVAQRSNVSSRLSQATAALDMTKWPAPVIRMFLGQMTPAAVLAAADDPDATKKRGQVCEANFFSGELALRLGTRDEAKRVYSGWRRATAQKTSTSGAQPMRNSRRLELHVEQRGRFGARPLNIVLTAALQNSLPRWVIRVIPTRAKTDLCLLRLQ